VSRKKKKVPHQWSKTDIAIASSVVLRGGSAFIVQMLELRGLALLLGGVTAAGVVTGLFAKFFAREDVKRKSVAFNRLVLAAYGFALISIFVVVGLRHAKVAADDAMATQRHDEEVTARVRAEEKAKHRLSADRVKNELRNWENQGHGVLRPGNELTRVPYEHFPMPEDAMVLLYGDSITGWSTGKYFAAIRHSGNNGLFVRRSIDGGISLEGTFFDQNGRQIGKIGSMNQFMIDPSIPDRDRFDVDLTTAPNTLIVTDSVAKKNLIEIKFINRNAMRLLADFYTSDGDHVQIRKDGVFVNSNGFRGLGFENAGVLEVTKGGVIRLVTPDANY
jgi:hypothetical protein